MLPAFAISPSNNLTPSRLECDSRPSRVDPDDFVVAIVVQVYYNFDMQFLYNTQEQGGKSIPARIGEHWSKRRELYVRFAEVSLVAAIFFGLGMLYAFDVAEKKAPIRVIEPQASETTAMAVGVLQPEKAAAKRIPAVQTGEYTASKNGTKYYPKGCPNRIKEENKIYFATPADAEKAGYSLAKNCSL